MGRVNEVCSLPPVVIHQAGQDGTGNGGGSIVAGAARPPKFYKSPLPLELQEPKSQPATPLEENEGGEGGVGVGGEGGGDVSSHQEESFSNLQAQVARAAMSLFTMARAICATNNTVSLELFLEETCLWSASGKGHRAPGEPSLGDVTGRGSLPTTTAAPPRKPTGGSLRQEPQPQPQPPQGRRESSRRRGSGRVGRVGVRDRGVQAAEEDLHRDARLQASRAYKKISRHYNRELADMKDALLRVEADNVEMAEGGGKYAFLVKENAALVGVVGECQAKIGELAQVVERCAAQIGRLEEEVEDKMRRLAVPQKISWEPARRVFSDVLLAEKRTDDSILREVVGRVAALQGSLQAEVERGERLTADIVRLRQEVAARDDDVDGLHAARAELLQQAAALRGDLAAAEEELRKKKQINTLTLHETQLLEVHSTQLTDLLLLSHKRVLRTLSPHKPAFSGFGKSRAVPLFLRYHGTITNIRMEKAALEKIISNIWLQREIDHFLRQHDASDPLSAAHAALRAPPRESDDPFAASSHRAAHARILPCWWGNGRGFFTALYDGGDPATVAAAAAAAAAASAAAAAAATEGGGEGADGVPDADAELLLTAKKRLKAAETRSRLAVSGLSSGERRWRLYAKLNYANTTDCGRRVLHGMKRFGEHVHDYLEETCDNASEVAYSLMEGLERYTPSADFELFQGVATGEFCEELYFDLHAMLDKLRMMLLEADAVYTAAGSSATPASAAPTSPGASAASPPPAATTTTAAAEVSWVDHFTAQAATRSGLVLRKNTTDNFPCVPGFPRMTGVLPGHKVSEVLEAFFQNKSLQDLRFLHLALYETLRGTSKGVGSVGLAAHSKTKPESPEERLRRLEGMEVPYRQILYPEAAHPTDPLFLEVLKAQYIHEHRLVSKELRAAFLAAAGVGAGVGRTQVLLRTVLGNIQEFDRKPVSEIVCFLDHVVRDSKATAPLFTDEASMPTAPFELPPMLDKLKNLLYKRYLPLTSTEKLEDAPIAQVPWRRPPPSPAAAPAQPVPEEHSMDSAAL